MSWRRLNLADERYAARPESPAWGGLVYRGKRHALSGPPEAIKTLISWAIAQNAIRDGASVAAVDFELGPEMTRLMLLELDFTVDEIASVHYFEPDEEPSLDDLHGLHEAGVDLVLVDALAGAYNASRLDDNKRADVEQWQARWIRPLYQLGIATLVIDHVVKNADNRGSFSIGSERKLGAVDVHLGLESIKPLARGGHGLYKLHIHKDRPGFLRAGGTREIELHSDPDTNAITWTITESGVAGAWQPTELMGRVVEYLGKQHSPVSLGQVEREVRGKATYLRKAVDALVAEGRVEEREGANRARLLRLIASSPSLVPSSSPVRPDVPVASPSLRPPLKGDEDGRDDGSLPSSGSPSRPKVGLPGYALFIDHEFAAGRMSETLHREHLRVDALVSNALRLAREAGLRPTRTRIAA